MENLINFNLLKEYDSTLKNVLGVWQKQKSYSVDDTIQYKGNYLKCTTAGTSGTTTLNFTGLDVGDTITDGTVVWEIIEPPSGNGNGLNDWKPNTEYKIGSIVVNDGQIYKALIEFTSGSTFENIELLEDYELQTGDTPIPWAEGTEISTNDIVEYNSNYYKAKVDFICGSIFTKNVFEEYVPKSLTDDDIDDIVEEFNPVQSGGAFQASGVPIGTVISFMGLTAPSDYLICDGTIYNITDYQALADHINIEFNSYNFFGGDGITTFAVPDLRGEFLRGTGTNSHTNQGSGANVGVHQDGTEFPYFGIGSDGTIYSQNIPSTGQNYPRNIDSSYNLNATGNSSGVNRSSSWTTSVNNIILSRPTNTSVLYCIKYR